jgi:hypothetical protein
MDDLAIFDLFLGHFRVPKQDFSVHLPRLHENCLKFLVETKSLQKCDSAPQAKIFETFNSNAHCGVV